MYYILCSFISFLILKEEKEEQIRKAFKSIDELKKDMNDLNLDMKTDYEIIKGLLEKFNQSHTLSREEKADILKDLEYYVHQVGYFKNRSVKRFHPETKNLIQLFLSSTMDCCSVTWAASMPYSQN
jgi:hypothetical protein